MQKYSWYLVAATFIVCANNFCPQSEAKKIMRDLNPWSSWSRAHNPAGYTFSGDHEGGDLPCSSAKLQSSLPQQKNAFASIFQSFAPTLFSGKKVKYSAEIKTDKVEGSAALWMTDQDGDRVIAFDDMSDRPISGTNDWKKCSIILDIPKESQKLRVGFILKGGGTAWMRKPELVEASVDEKSTARPFDKSKFILDWLDKSPSNLTFVQKNYISDRINDVSQWGVHTDENYRVQISRKVLDHGKASVQADSTGETKDGFASLHQSFDAANYRNKRVCFTADIKNTSNADWSTPFMQIDGADNVIVFDALENRRLKNLKNWTPTSIVLDVPPESKKIKIGFLHAGSGKAWISNLSFKTVGTQVPVTAKSGAIEKLPKQRLQLRPEFRFD